MDLSDGLCGNSVDSLGSSTGNVWIEGNLVDNIGSRLSAHGGAFDADEVWPVLCNVANNNHTGHLINPMGVAQNANSAALYVSSV